MELGHHMMMGERVRREALSVDGWRAVAPSLALVVSVVLVDRAVDRFVDLPIDAYFERTILLEAIRSQPALAGLFVVGVAGFVAITRTRALIAWTEIDHGHVLRWLAIPLVLLLAWRHGLYEYNFVFDRWHAIDRSLVLILAGAALWRPVFLLPFVMQMSVIGDQFPALLGGRGGRNVDELVVMALLVVGLVYGAAALGWGRRLAADAVGVIGLVVAAAFVYPGRNKLRLGGWLDTDLANFPRSSAVAGWLGHTDGGWTDTMADLLDTFSPLVLAATLLVELGAVLAVVHHRSLRWWLVGAMTFHIGIFAASGFWLFEWVVLEAVVVLAVSALVRVDAWPGPSIPRGIVAMAVVVAGSALFQPPPLAWLDAPVAQAYAIEGVGESGQTYNVPASALEPVSVDITFLFTAVDDRLLVVGAYGAMGSEWEYARVADIATIDELQDLQADQPEVAEDVQALSELVFVRFLEHVAVGNPPGGWLPAAPPRTWTSAPDPSYDFGEPLVGLRVYRVDAIHASGERAETLVLAIELDDAGRAVLVPSS